MRPTIIRFLAAACLAGVLERDFHKMRQMCYVAGWGDVPDTVEHREVYVQQTFGRNDGEAVN